MFLAELKKPRMLIAVKSIATDSDKAVAIINKELESLRKVCGHPNVVELMGWHNESHSVWIAMAYCAGDTLADYLREQSGRLDERTAWFFLKQMAEGLKHLHHMLIWHRDLKPANLLLADKSEMPRLVIADFGFSRQMWSPSAKASTLCGTVWYAAPEVLNGEQYDSRCDMWSVGAILFEMLAGKLPWTIDDQMSHEPRRCAKAMQRADLDLPSDVAMNVSVDCRQLLQELLAVVERIDPLEFFEHKYLKKYCLIRVTNTNDTETPFVMLDTDTVDTLAFAYAKKHRVSRHAVKLYKGREAMLLTDATETLKKCGLTRAGGVLLRAEVGITPPTSPAGSSSSASSNAAVPAAPAVAGYNSLKKSELQKICSTRGIAYTSKTKKAELVALLEQKPSSKTSASSSSASTPNSKPPAKQSIKTATKKDLLAAGVTDHQATCLITWRDKGKQLDSWDDVQAAMKNSEVAVGKLKDNNFTIK